MYSSRPVRPVYLLQPYGKLPIEEPAYEGYGDFGEVNALDWLAMANLTDEQLAGMTEEQIRTAGIALDVGHLYRDVDPVHGSFYLVPVFTGSGPVVDCIHLTEDFGFTETFGPVPNPVHVYRIGKAVGIWKGVL